MRFALEMRCAMVASGTRKALAISAVVSPPTARSVSAIDDAGVSDGWQHMNSNASVSSSSALAGAGGSSRAVCRSRVDTGPLAADLVDQPAARRPEEPGARVRRDPVAWPVVGGRDQRLLDGILGGVEVARAAGERAEDLRRQLAQQVLDGGWDAQRAPPRARFEEAVHLGGVRGRRRP